MFYDREQWYSRKDVRRNLGKTDDTPEDPYGESSPENVLKYLQENKLVNGFEVYKVYLTIKLHFTSKNQSYDYR